jgi:hypothetical protein
MSDLHNKVRRSQDYFDICVVICPESLSGFEALRFMTTNIPDYAVVFFLSEKDVVCHIINAVILVVKLSYETQCISSPFSVLINEFLIAFEASKTTDAIEFGYRYFENLRFASRIFPPARVILVTYSTNIDAIFTTLRITRILISMTLAWITFQINK